MFNLPILIVFSIFSFLITIPPLLYSEVITSEEFKFVAIFPYPVSSTDGDSSTGRIKTFQSYDEENRLLHILTANKVPQLLHYTPKDKEENQEFLDVHLSSRLTTTPYEKTSFEKKWYTWGEKEGIEFSYTSKGFIEEVTSYHSSLLLYFPGFFYTITVVSFESLDSSKTQLADFITKFSISNDINHAE